MRQKSSGIDELRDVLFETLRELKAGNMETERARAINETAQTLINSAKLEVEYVKMAGGESRFISGGVACEVPALEQRATGSGIKTVTSVTGGTVTQHRMR